MRVQGIDVGAWGGATMLHPNGALAQVAAWKPCTRKGARRVMAARVTRIPDGTWVPGGPYVFASLSEMGHQLATWSEAPCRICAEGAHVGRNAATSVKQAMNVGRLVAHGERLLDPSGAALIVQPQAWKGLIMPPEWRRRAREATGEKLSASDADKWASLAYVPRRVPGLTVAMTMLAALLKVEPSKLHHVTDSAGVAAYVHLGGR